MLTIFYTDHQPSLCSLHSLGAITLLTPLPEMSFYYGSAHKPSPPLLSRFSPNHLPSLVIHPPSEERNTSLLDHNFAMSSSLLTCLPHFLRPRTDLFILLSYHKLRRGPWTYMDPEIHMLIKCYNICMCRNTYIHIQKQNTVDIELQHK